MRYCCYFTLQYDLLWKLYNIELGDQEFFTQFISIDILWAHGLHIVPLWRKHSMASAFLCGPAVFCSTGSVFATHGRFLFLCSPWEGCAHNSHKGEKVVKMLLTHLFCSRLDREGRQTRRRGGGGTSFTAEPPNVMDGAAHCRHGNTASVIFDFDQQQGSAEIPLTCFLLSR